MITHQTLYNLANSLGILAMLTVVGYHFVAVNARYLAKNQKALINECTSFTIPYYSIEHSAFL